MKKFDPLRIIHFIPQIFIKQLLSTKNLLALGIQRQNKTQPQPSESLPPGRKVKKSTQ